MRWLSLSDWVTVCSIHSRSSDNWRAAVARWSAYQSQPSVVETNSATVRIRDAASHGQRLWMNFCSMGGKARSPLRFLMMATPDVPV